MTSRKESFEELMNGVSDRREQMIVTRFLEETVEALNARYHRTALRVTVDFDRFTKDAYDHDKPLYARFFATLSALIKDYHLDDWNPTDHTLPEGYPR